MIGTNIHTDLGLSGAVGTDKWKISHSKLWGTPHPAHLASPTDAEWGICWADTRRQAEVEIFQFMQPNSSSSCDRNPTTGPILSQFNPTHTFNHYFPRLTCIIHRIFSGWLNQGEWDRRDMWHAWGREEAFTGFWWGGPKGRDHWEDLGVVGRITLSWTLGR